jgi:5-methylcytosine-specific restriction enzyme A
MISRKEFIESQGATCKNWTWSWSFVNHREKVVIFGAWDRYTKGSMALILSEDWSINSNGKKRPGFNQSREHIRLIEEQGYTLKTFPMKYSDANKDENDIGPAKIGDFTPRLDKKNLERVGKNWYASDGKISIKIAEEIEENEVDKIIVGASKVISVNSFERDSVARAKCLAHHGYKCAVCSFDFEEFYGSIGKSFIHVHHVIPFSEVKEAYLLDPLKDLVPVCPNCHAMIHRTRPILTIAQLKEHLKTKNA